MFSLIITIISVALVAALALATLYYGGETFNQGRADAQAAQILNQGQQVLGAAELYYLKNSAWPNTTQDLVDGGFLESVPVAKGPLSEAHAQAIRSWEMPTAGVPVFTLSDIETDICRTVNKKTYGMDGVLKQAYTSLAAQCYGETSNAYTVVVSKSGERLTIALPPSDLSPSPALPSPSDPSPWDVQPGEDVVGGAGPGGSDTATLPGMSFTKLNATSWRTEGAIIVEMMNTGSVALDLEDAGFTATLSGDSATVSNLYLTFSEFRVGTQESSGVLSFFCDAFTLNPAESTYCFVDKIDPLVETGTGAVNITIQRGSDTVVLNFPAGAGGDEPAAVAEGWPSLPDDWDSSWLDGGYAQGAANWGVVPDMLEPSAKVETPFVDYYKENGHQHGWQTILVHLRNGGVGDSYEVGAGVNGPNPRQLAQPYPTVREHATVISLTEEPVFLAKESSYLRLHTNPSSQDATIAGMGLQRCALGTFVDTTTASGTGCVLVLEYQEGPQPPYDPSGDGSYICGDPNGCDEHTTPHYFWGKASLKGLDQNGDPARIEFSVVVGEAHPFY